MMPVPPFWVVGLQRMKFRIVPARETSVFHISCHSDPADALLLPAITQARLSADLHGQA